MLHTLFLALPLELHYIIYIYIYICIYICMYICICYTRCFSLYHWSYSIGILCSAQKKLYGEHYMP